MFTDSILGLFEDINGMILNIAGGGGALLGPFSGFNATLFGFARAVQQTISMQTGGVILTLFFVLELYSVSTKTQSMGGSAASGTEMVFMALFKLVVCRWALENTGLLMEAAYEATTFVTSGIAAIVGGGTGPGSLNLAALRPLVAGMGLGEQLSTLIFVFVAKLITIASTLAAELIVTVRFIELYVYFAIAPIPLATLPNAELGQIGKGFLKSFAAVSLQGTLIFLVLAFFPYIMSGAFTSSDITAAMIGVMGYAVVIMFAVFSTGKWAKAIASAM